MRKRPLNSLNKAKRGDNLDEKEILSLIKEEASSFVPNDLSAIEKATGTFNPFKERSDLTITEMFHNEGVEIVPNLKNQIMQKAGVKTTFSFSRFVRSHLTSIILTTVVVAGGLTAGILISGSENTLGAADGTLVSVSFQSASSYELQKGEALYSYDAASSKVNNYIPTFAFQVQNKNNLALKDTLSPCNYSASLISKNESKLFTSFSDEKAPSFLSRLLKPTYEQGYLEAVDGTRNNNITITVISSDQNYLSNYQDDYLKEINDALSDDENSIHTYAKVEFVDASSHVANFSNMGKDKAKSIAMAYWLYQVNGNPTISFNTLCQEDETIVNSLAVSATAVRSAPLSPKAMDNAISGAAKAYADYKAGKQPCGEVIDSLKQKMIENFSCLPWSQSSDSETLKKCLLTNAYYLISDDRLEQNLPTYSPDMRIHDGATALSFFFHTRDAITSGLNFNSLLKLLDEVKNAASQSSSPFPDGFQGEMGKDGGGHHPGEGDQFGGGVR